MICFNLPILEWKLDRKNIYGVQRESLNRPILELKYVIDWSNKLAVNLLIAPYWN